MRKVILIISVISMIVNIGCGQDGQKGKSPQLAIIVDPQNQSISEGGNLVLTVVATGKAPLHYQWMKGESPVGSDSAYLNIDAVQTVDEDTYHVDVSDSSGKVTSKPAIISVTPVNLADRTFTLAVWLQDALDTIELNGKEQSVAKHYKDIGINTFAGLWLWPTEDWAYHDYSLLTANELKLAGMKVYAGNDKAAVDWINAHPELQSTIIGYLLGDEPDMNRDSGVPEQAAANTPTAWKASGDALKGLDPVRPVYANFGKPFAKDVWYGTENGAAGSSKEQDFALYVAPTDIISSDYYGITDPWELPENHGVWTYGRAVKNTLKYAGSRTVWGFVEGSGPWPDASSNNWMYQKMPPSLIMPIVWNMIINGAQGIVYFCHDFSPNTSTNTNRGKYALLLEPGMYEAVKAANESVMAFGAVIKSPAISGTVVSTTGSVNIISLTKRFNGITYIFAMGEGNSSYPRGLAVDAEITVSGETGVKSVTVLNDLRNVVMTNGVMTDHFEPYELHIYRIN